MIERAHGLRRGWRVGAAIAAVAAFAILAGRFWHPYYGFTRFVQLDEADARAGIPEIRAHPVFTYEGFHGYDGAAYTQIAFHPLLDSPDLQPAIGNVPYRARRILGSALAWLLAGGNPAHIANTYAALNLGVWLVLAALLWRVIPVTDGRTWFAWAGVMFSAGALHSVRLALTDLLAATLVLAAVWLGERARLRPALGVLAAAGLARETALAGIVGMWRGPWWDRSAWLANFGRAALVTVPFLLWIAYIRWQAGPAAQGFGNFTWPIVGWIEKWSETFADFSRQPGFRWLNTTTLLALIGVTVQAGYFLKRRRPEDPWWRVGAVSVLMMALLGTSVWEGHPGAATRVLLPMGIAFAVLSGRSGAPLAWILLGSLSVFSGVLALWDVPQAPRELAAGQYSRGAYVVRLEEGWYGVERNRRSTWAWAGQHGGLSVATAPRSKEGISVQLKLRAISPRTVEIRSADALLWRGTVGEKLEQVVVTVPPDSGHRYSLTLHSVDAPIRENDHPDARGLGFAIYGVSLH